MTKPAPQVPQTVRTKLVGKKAWYPADDSWDSMAFLVRIIDVKNRFGHVDALVQPEEGYGEKWVDSARLRVRNK